ncbi:MAG: hypothetical protein AAGD07_23250 [Planctomycetota bacterium]
MRLRARQVTLCIALVLVALALFTDSRSDAKQVVPVRNEIFRDKIVTVYMDDPLKGSGQVMRDARLEQIGDRWILVGKGVSTGQPGEWDEGLTTGMAWDAVTAFYVFTPAQFEEKMKALSP